MGAELFAALPLAQSTVSEHLKVLREAGLVSATASGTATLFCIKPAALRALAASLDDLAGRSPGCP
jgi:ArsR family transcriptional regulator